MRGGRGPDLHRIRRDLRRRRAEARRTGAQRNRRALRRRRGGAGDDELVRRRRRGEHPAVAVEHDPFAAPDQLDRLASEARFARDADRQRGERVQANHRALEGGVAIVVGAREDARVLRRQVLLDRRGRRLPEARLARIQVQEPVFAIEPDAADLVLAQLQPEAAQIRAAKGDVCRHALGVQRRLRHPAAAVAQALVELRAAVAGDERHAAARPLVAGVVDQLDQP